MKDVLNTDLPDRVVEIEHRYGDRVHLLGDLVAHTMLAEMGSPAMPQPRLNRWLGRLYDRLLDAVLIGEFPRTARSIPSRMETHHPGINIEGTFLDRGTKVQIAAVARAGTLPGHRCFERLSELLDPQAVRLDHLFMNRHVTPAGEVIGVDYRGGKIGGPVEDRYLLIPDPMGATGSTMSYALDVYEKEVGGHQRRSIAMHLIVTPEYLQAMSETHPELVIYALRLDRGLSEPEVLETVPGTFPDREKGLDARHYIVPGMGGLGELINNAFV